MFQETQSHSRMGNAEQHQASINQRVRKYEIHLRVKN